MTSRGAPHYSKGVWHASFKLFFGKLGFSSLSCHSNGDRTISYQRPIKLFNPPKIDEEGEIEEEAKGKMGASEGKEGAKGTGEEKK